MLDSSFKAFVIVAAALVVSPGATMAVVTEMALQRGRFAALLTVAGVNIANSSLAMASALGSFCRASSVALAASSRQRRRRHLSHVPGIAHPLAYEAGEQPRRSGPIQAGAREATLRHRAGNAHELPESIGHSFLYAPLAAIHSQHGSILPAFPAAGCNTRVHEPPVALRVCTGSGNAERANGAAVGAAQPWDF